MDESEEKEGGAANSEDEEDEPAVPRDAKAQDEYESKRRKRLELNRKAAQESRRRKKLRIEELQRSVVFLTRENSELREQNELLRQMLATEVPGENSATSADRFQAENTALKLALYESVQNLTRTKQGLMNQQQAAANAAPIAASAQNTSGPGNGAGQGTGVQLSQMPGGLPTAQGIIGGSQGVNMAGMVDALNAGRMAAMPHMMGLTPAMLMARQQSAAAMLGMANAQQQQQLADAAAFQQQQLARAAAAATTVQPAETTPAAPASDSPPAPPAPTTESAPPAGEEEQQSSAVASGPV